MEVLKEILEYQNSLEDALRLESTPDEVQETKDGKKLFKWLKYRRRMTNRLIKVLSKYVLC